MQGEMSNWDLHKFYKWVWSWPWTFKAISVDYCSEEWSCWMLCSSVHRNHPSQFL